MCRDGCIGIVGYPDGYAPSTGDVQVDVTVGVLGLREDRCLQEKQDADKDDHGKFIKVVFPLQLFFHPLCYIVASISMVCFSI